MAGLDDLLLLLVEHWARDEHVFPTEDDRHYVATILLFQSYTGCRPAEFVHSSKGKASEDPLGEAEETIKHRRPTERGDEHDAKGANADDGLEHDDGSDAGGGPEYDDGILFDSDDDDVGLYDEGTDQSADRDSGCSSDMTDDGLTRAFTHMSIRCDPGAPKEVPKEVMEGLFAADPEIVDLERRFKALSTEIKWEHKFIKRALKEKRKEHEDLRKQLTNAKKSLRTEIEDAYGEWGFGKPVLGPSFGNNDIYDGQGQGCTNGHLAEFEDWRHDFEQDAIGEQWHVHSIYLLYWCQ